MSLHSAPIVPKAQAPNPLHRGLDVVVAARAAVDRDGWPRSWQTLREQAETCLRETMRRHDGAVPEYHLQRLTLGDLVKASYDASLAQAYFRQGDDDRACLVAQAW